MPSPIESSDVRSDGVGVALIIDLATIATLRTLPAARLVGVPLGDQTVSIDVRQVEPFAADARIVCMTASGEVAIPAPELLVLAGSVVGHDGSTAILSFAPSGVNGLIEMDGRQFVFSSGPALDGAAAVAVELTPGSVAALDLRSHGCGTEQLVSRAPESASRSTVGGASRGDPPCRLATIALETDNEYLDHFGGSVGAATAYAGTLIAASSEIFARDTGARMQIGFLRIWEAADPWTTNDALEQIYQFQDYWNLNMTDVARHAVHYLTPRALSGAGGLAYLSGLCQVGYDYGLSAYLSGHFPYPIVNNDGQNWDLMVVSHELGHNFGAPHTHDMSPPIDGCAFGDCSVVPNGTIMSYCHACAGGMANVRMEFHSRTVSEEILPYLADGAPCNTLAEPASISAQPASLVACPDSPVLFTVSAAGSGTLIYQWRRDGADIPAATGASYSIAAYSPPSNSGMYTVLVSNACGGMLSAGATLSPCASPPHDIDSNCAVDISDLAVLLSHFGQTGGAAYADGDLDGDGDVDLADLALMLSGFGSSGC